MNATVPFSGVLLVDKPAGPTSFDVVRRARRGVGRRVGHAGTLDPFATGLLLVFIGQATRLCQLFLGLPKEYELTVKFGQVSNTGDATGDITERGGHVTKDVIVRALDRFRGEIEQQVPLTSAVKVDGEALYKKAHRGEQVTTPRRRVSVYDLCLVDFSEEKQTARVLALTGSGTYLRVLAEDLGEAVGAGAYASALRRTRIGRFCVDGAVPMEEISPELYEGSREGVLGVDEALQHLPSIEVSGGEARLAANGNILSVDRVGRFRVYGGDRLLGIYRGEAGRAHPVVVFPTEVL